MKELRKVMKGEQQRWDKGKKISIALMKTTHAVGESTAARIFDMSGNELNKYWLALVFQGKAKAPNFFNSETDLLNYVAITPGAIGIVDAVSSHAANKVLIEGKESI
jgi:hypothetical protein